MNNYEFEADIYTEGIFDAELTAGGAATASDYDALNNKPMINGNVLVGNKTSEELGIITEDDVANLVEGYEYATASALEAEATARENADDALSDRIDNLALIGSAEGTNIQIADASNNCGLYSLYIEGESFQNGTPSSDNPIDIESIGDSGSLSVTTCGKNLLNVTAVYSEGITTTITDGNVFNISGTSNSGGWANITKAYADNGYTLQAGKTYTLSISNPLTFRVGIKMYTESASQPTNYIIPSGRTSVTFTLNENEKHYQVFIEGLGANVDWNISFILQLEEGSASDIESPKINTATITTSLPLCSVGDVRDEFIFNADGTAKIIKRFEKIVLNGSETWSESPTRETAIKRQLLYLSKPCANNSSSVLTNAVCSHYQLRTGNGTFTRQIGISVVTNFSTEQTPLFIYDDRYNSEGVTSDFKAWLSENPVTLIYELRYPEEINLTADETNALLGLETYSALTNIFNSDNADMNIKYWRNEDVGSLLTSISRNTNSRLTALENAILGG